MKTLQEYHDDLRFELDQIDETLSLYYSLQWPVLYVKMYRHMLIEELNRVQNLRWDHG